MEGVFGLSRAEEAIVMTKTNPVGNPNGGCLAVVMFALFLGMCFFIGGIIGDYLDQPPKPPTDTRSIDQRVHDAVQILAERHRKELGE